MQENWKKYIPWVLVLLSLGFKLVHISTFPIQLDEPFSIFTSNLAWSEFWQVFLHENNPPLHPILLKLLIECVGMNDFWMRFISVLFASLATWFTYKSAEKLAGFEAGIIAGLCLVFSNQQMMYAHQIRAYSLLVSLAAMSFYFLIKVLKKESKYSFVYLGISCALMMYTHFMGIVFTGFLGVSLLMYWKDTELRKQLLLAFVCAGVLFAPYLPIFYTRFGSANEGTWLEAPQGLISIYYSYWKFFNAPLTTIVAIISVVSAAYLTCLKSTSKELKLSMLLILLTFLGLWVLSQSISLYIERYLIYIAPVLYTLIALNSVYWAKKINNKWISLSVMTLMPVLMMATFKIDADIKQNQNPQWQAINDIKGGKVLVISPAWEDLNYCYYTDKEKYFLGSRKAFETTRKADNIIVDYEFIANITQYKSKNVLVSIKSLDSNIELKKVLDDHFVFLNEHSSNLLEFAPKP